jgi:Protein of unknown function DUF262
MTTQIKTQTAVFTIAEYCAQMRAHTIRVNWDYQRTNKVWPPAAQSFLVDTILLGYPLTKMILWQKYDKTARMPIKEIVDGQQRSTAIAAFLNNEFRITTRGSFTGLRFDDLDEEHQQFFADYSLTVDLLTGITEDDVRQIFWRMNSYTVPLNRQEKRHSEYQGELRWFILDLSREFGTALKDMGAVTQKQISRMQEAEFLAELVQAMLEGIKTASPGGLDTFYKRYEKTFQSNTVLKPIEEALGFVIECENLRNTKILKPFSLFSLLLARMHSRKALPELTPALDVDWKKPAANATASRNLAHLADLLDNCDVDSADFKVLSKDLQRFLLASRSGTNTKHNRTTRFRMYYRAFTQRGVA